MIVKTTFRKFKMGGIIRVLYEVLLAAIYQAMDGFDLLGADSYVHHCIREKSREGIDRALKIY